MSVGWLRGVASTPVRTPAEWAVLMALAVHAGHAAGMAWPSVPKVAGMTGLSVRHVRSCLRALEAQGVIEHVQLPERLPATGTVRSRAYRVLID